MFRENTKRIKPDHSRPTGWGYGFNTQHLPDMKKRKRKKKETGFPQIRTPDFTTMLGFDRELNKSFCGCSTQLNTNKLWHCSEHWISQPAREEFCSKQTWSVMTGLRWECYQSNKHKDIRSLVHSVYLRFHKIWIRLKYIILYH